MSDFSDLGVIGKLVLPSFLKFWTCRKPSLGSIDMVPRIEATGVFLARWRTFFLSRFRLDRGKSWQSESHTSCLSIFSLLKLWTCGSHCSESERIYARARHPRGEKCEIFSIVLFPPSVFVRTVDVAPNVGFWRSWCRWKACTTFFLKVPESHEGELGFMRCGPTNRGCRSVSLAEGHFPIEIPA